MADSSDLIQHPAAVVVQTYPVYRSDLEHIAEFLLADWWCEEQVQDYGLRLDRETLSAALLNVLTGHWEEMLKSWGAEDWLRGDLGTDLQTEIKRLGAVELERAA
jgi:hypothetical protein